MPGHVLLAAAAPGHSATPPEPFTGPVGTTERVQSVATRDGTPGRTGTENGGSENLFRSAEF